MKKEMVLQRSVMVPGTSGCAYRASWHSCFMGWLLGRSWLIGLSSFYARLLEVRVSPLQALYLTHTQLAFFAMVFPIYMPLLVRFLFLLWFCLALIQCRKAGLH